ncbi:MAG: xanthine dehydrogenase accessory protein XdhC [Nocardiopsaceae bacterium]|nr:xanthine dehydrogenase accessory protein XdhC [Nocardiopsaceae bacterium]
MADGTGTGGGTWAGGGTWIGGATWIDAVVRLRSSRTPGVLVTLTAVRGHAPRKAGAKMVVAASATWGSIGGGNLEAMATDRARALIADGASEPATLSVALSDRAPYVHGVQCCGGEASVLLEPLPVVTAIAIFGVGHVGFELARILARHDLDLHLIDGRAGQLAAGRLAVLADAVARVRVHEAPVLPEMVLSELPPGTHVLIMTHDHAEDAALCDAAVRLASASPASSSPASPGQGGFGSIGLIGSPAKWARFRRRLAAEGGLDPAAIERIKTPIGLPDLEGKEPATIAVSVAADLLRTIERERASAGRDQTPAGRDRASAERDRAGSEVPR